MQTVSIMHFQDAPHFNIDGKLRDILKVTPGACLQYAVIEGNPGLTICLSYTSLFKRQRVQLWMYVVCVCLHCRCCATCRRASDKSLPERVCGSFAEIPIKRTQASVEQPFTNMVRTVSQGSTPFVLLRLDLPFFLNQYDKEKKQV